MKYINLNIGDITVCSAPAVLETILGSCVSVCMWDRAARVGGMNHVMLPRRSGEDTPSCLCCAESVEMLVARMLGHGASLPNITAKLFGGGRVIKGIARAVDVGGDNVKVARATLVELGIPVVGECIMKPRGLKVRFHAHTGRAFVKYLEEVR